MEPDSASLLACSIMSDRLSATVTRREFGALVAHGHLGGRVATGLFDDLEVASEARWVQVSPVKRMPWKTQPPPAARVSRMSWESSLWPCRSRHSASDSVVADDNGVTECLGHAQMSAGPRSR